MSLTIGLPEIALQDELKHFEEKLTPQQKNDLRAQCQQCTASDVLMFTVTLDDELGKRRSRRLAHRLHVFLESVQEFSSVADTFAQESTRVQKAVCCFFAMVLGFCGSALQFVQKSAISQYIKAAWKPFKVEFGKTEIDFEAQRQLINEEVALASEQAAELERKSQIVERKEAAAYRLLGVIHRKKADAQWAKNEERRVSTDDKINKKKQARLLASLSTYDHTRAFRRDCQKRHGTTGSWLVESDDFQSWLRKDPSTMWLSGKPGSGKTILSTAVVSAALAHFLNSSIRIAYYFCRYDEYESLAPETILGNLARQFLEGLDMPELVQHMLEPVSVGGRILSIEDLTRILEEVMLMSRDASVIIIDGINECEAPDLAQLINSLKILVDNTSCRLFISSRPELQIKRKRGNLFTISMSSPYLSSDINSYIKDEVNRKAQEGSLIVADSNLISEICQALIEGADGMFLWVKFQILDICDGPLSDAAIRDLLRNLPKDLPATYNRALARISRKADAISGKVFRLIAIVKRPLNLEELQEALAIDVGQTSWIPEKLVNDPESILLACGSLVTMDEDTQLLSFAHKTVKMFLNSDLVHPSLSSYRLDLKAAEIELAEVCVTYPNFTDLERQVFKARRQEHLDKLFNVPPSKWVAPINGSGSLCFGFLTKFDRMRKLRTPSGLEIERILYNTRRGMTRSNSSDTFNVVQAQFQFLNYITTFWIAHTAALSPKKIEAWTLFKRLINEPHSLAYHASPWTQKELTTWDESIVCWITNNHHLALLRVYLSSSRDTRLEDQTILLIDSILRGNKELSDILVRGMHNLSGAAIERAAGRSFHGISIGTPLQAAAVVGDLELVKAMLHCRVRDELKEDDETSWTSLQIASREGHYEIIDVLLADRADVNSRPAVNGGLTALQAASREGSIKNVDLLLTYGARVNADPAIDHGRTALQAACEGGHLEVVKLLLAHHAKVDKTPSQHSGRTALQAAAQNGDVRIMDYLLNAATESNHTIPATLQRVMSKEERLFKAKASPPSRSHGRTALQAAAEEGHIIIVRKLLEGPNPAHLINAEPSRRYGRTALEAATASGHLHVVKELLARGHGSISQAHLDAALGKAAKRKDFEIVKALLKAGGGIRKHWDSGASDFVTEVAEECGFEGLALFLRNKLL
ncbi:MAG: hypothetical protein M1827_006890 [Pycnora praestabilis]|nr:MAG: hypothetical protein M1827_006890 [Pycnora praestabilis]